MEGCGGGVGKLDKVTVLGLTLARRSWEWELAATKWRKGTQEIAHAQI